MPFNILNFANKNLKLGMSTQSRFTAASSSTATPLSPCSETAALQLAREKAPFGRKQIGECYYDRFEPLSLEQLKMVVAKQAAAEARFPQPAWLKKKLKREAKGQGKAGAPAGVVKAPARPKERAPALAAGERKAMRAGAARVVEVRAKEADPRIPVAMVSNPTSSPSAVSLFAPATVAIPGEALEVQQELAVYKCFELDQINGRWSGLWYVPEEDVQWYTKHMCFKVLGYGLVAGLSKSS